VSGGRLSREELAQFLTYAKSIALQKYGVDDGGKHPDILGPTRTKETRQQWAGQDEIGSPPQQTSGYFNPSFAIPISRND